jgi:hypothetical protein
VLVALALMVAAPVALFRFIGRLLNLMRPRRIHARLLRAFAVAVEDVYPPCSRPSPRRYRRVSDDHDNVSQGMRHIQSRPVDELILRFG